MADEKRVGDIPQDDRPSDNTGLSPLEEAMRIAEGKTLAEAQAEKTSAGAELPGIMEHLGNSVREYTDLLNKWNQTESDRLADEHSRPFVESKKRLDAALSQATENPTEDMKKALEDYREANTDPKEGVFLKLLALNGLLSSAGEEQAPGPAGNDLMPDLFLAKWILRTPFIDTQGPRQENAQGQVSYAFLEKPRTIPDAEKQRLARQTLAGWFQFKWGMQGMELPSEDAEAFAGQIMNLVNHPPNAKK